MNTTDELSGTQFGPLPITYSMYKDMYDNDIIFGYRGVVTSDLVTNVLDIMGERLEEDGQSKKLSKKVFNIMVECLTNVYVDEVKRTEMGYDPSALLIVKRMNRNYRVITGNQILTKDVGDLKSMIDKINRMTYDELKAYYQEVLCLEEPTATGLTSLAIIDLARKSKNKLNYNFKFESEHYSFFSLESEISPNSL
jgi:hypothetical protein